MFPQSFGEINTFRKLSFFLQVYVQQEPTTMGLPVISRSPNTKTSQVLYCREFSAFQGFAINPDRSLKTPQWDTSFRELLQSCHKAMWAHHQLLQVQTAGLLTCLCANLSIHLFRWEDPVKSWSFFGAAIALWSSTGVTVNIHPSGSPLRTLQSWLNNSSKTDFVPCG